MTHPCFCIRQRTRVDQQRWKPVIHCLRSDTFCQSWQKTGRVYDDIDGSPFPNQSCIARYYVEMSTRLGSTKITSRVLSLFLLKLIQTMLYVFYNKLFRHQRANSSDIILILTLLYKVTPVSLTKQTQAEAGGGTRSIPDLGHRIRRCHCLVS